MVAQSSETAYEIGKRIDCSGHFGTIKYVGPVEGYPGVWLGIDWDDEERGKHNGRVNGIHYFDTRLPKSGSLVRKEKVNFGQNLIDSIKTRYGYRDNEATAKKSKEELLRFQQQINAPFLQFVGFEQVAEKQRDFQSLEIVNVRLQKVCSIGDLASVCPNVREIDISKNLLSSWTDVFAICSQLRNLKWINLSENLLYLPETIEKCVFPGISVLICGSMELTFEEINRISAIFPNVEELRVPYNHITDLTLQSDHNFKRLRYLDLEGNDIKLWSEILNLSAIKTLEHLIIENVKLESIRFDENVVPVNYFRRLETLNINDNLISEFEEDMVNFIKYNLVGGKIFLKDHVVPHIFQCKDGRKRPLEARSIEDSAKKWLSIAELNKLESLKHLRFLKNPVLETENIATREQMVVAMIKNLKGYNGRLIRDDERRGAEYDYIKKYALHWIHCQSEKKKKRFLEEHNRFSELIETHGLPEEAELVIKPNIIQTSLVNLTFQYKDRILLKKLPQNILIQKLILLIQKMFKLKDRPILVYTSTSKPDIKINLCDELKELCYYSVEDGDTIIVKDEDDARD